MTELSPITAKSMVRLFVSGIGRCVLSILSIGFFLSIISDDAIARDTKNFTFPKGIVLNAGQYPSSVYAYAHAGNAIIWFDSEGLLFDVQSPSGGYAIRMKFPNQQVRLQKGSIIQERNVIHGNEVSKEECLQSLTMLDKFGSDISTFAMNEHGLQWIINSDVQEVEYMIEGADSISIDDSLGELYMHVGTLRFGMHAPFLKPINGQSMAMTMVKEDNRRIAFRIPKKTNEQLLGVPLLFTTFIGGTLSETINAITLDQNGNIYVLGETDSPNYPISTGAYIAPNAVPKDIFIAKFDSTGKNIIYSSRIGGNQVELGTSIAVDTMGQVYAAGSTTSKNFPTTQNAFQTDKTLPNEDVFVIKLNAEGNSLLYGTFMMGMTTDIAHSINVDEQGGIYVAGETRILSRNPHTFPKTQNAFDTSYNGGSSDAFIAKLNPAGKGNSDLQFCTLIGGNESDIAFKITLAKNGDLIVAGETTSDSLFPITKDAVQNTYHGLSDGFIAVLSPKGDSLKYSSYIGGSGDERITGLVFDEQSQSIIFAGITNSDGIQHSGIQNPIKFPVTKGAYDTTYNGGNNDGFICKLNPFVDSELKYSTYIGGSGDDYVLGLGVDVCAAPYVTGTTTSSDFPITFDASDSTIQKNEGFVTKLNALANVLVFSSYIGNEEGDQLNGIYVDQSGAIYLGGSAQVNASSTNGRDGFLVKLQVGILPLKPTIDKIGNLSFCKGDSVVLDATSRNLISYQWRKDNVPIPGANASTLIVKSTGIFSVDVADASGCTGSESIKVTAFDRPGLTIAKVPVICPGDSVRINAISADSLQEILWSPALGLSCTTCLNPIASPPMSMSYILKTVDTNGCARFDTVLVKVIDSKAVSAQSLADTLVLCRNASTILQVPLTNTSDVDLIISIVSLSDTALSAKSDSILIPADSAILIPITFNGVQTIGVKEYSIVFSDHCGSLKTARCFINVQNPSFVYTLDSITEICRTDITRQTITITNQNGLSGTVAINSTETGFSSSRSSIFMKPYGRDSITVEYLGMTPGLIPVKFTLKHECGVIDTLTWNIRVISNPYALSWNKDTTIHALDKPIIKMLEIDNLSKQRLQTPQSFNLSIVHEYSTLQLDSILSFDCGVSYSRLGDTINIYMKDCKDSSKAKAFLHFTGLVGETLKPWLRITNFSSVNTCIDPILNNMHDTISLDTYGCELSTIKVNRTNAQLKSVRLNQAQKELSIRYANVERTSGRFICINAIGQVMNAINIPLIEPGEHELSMQIDICPSGVYTLIYESGNNIESSLFMIME